MSYQAESRLPIFCVDKISPIMRALPIEFKLALGSEGTQQDPPLVIHC
jgi:hypothetical protein